MTKQQEVIDILKQNRKQMKSFGVKRLGLFGSFARGDAGASSDLDFVVEFERKTFDAYMGLKIFLEELFHRPVDLVMKDSIKPRLRDVILKETIYA